MRIMHIRMQQPLFEAWIINVVLRAPGWVARYGESF
jgi:hypothetical protein